MNDGFSLFLGSSFSFVVYSDGDGDVMKILDDGEIL